MKAIKKNYKSDYEDGGNQEDEEMMDETNKVVKDQKASDDELKHEVEEENLKKHTNEKDNLYVKQQKEMHQNMKHYLNCGFNILLYGVGSKRNFLNNFVQQYLYVEPKVYVNGFHSAITMKALTTHLLKFANKQRMRYADKNNTKSNMTFSDQLESVKRIFGDVNFQEQGFKRYTVVIHSMDVGALKSSDWQVSMSELADIKGISLIVSLDHIKAGIMWSEQMVDRFNFMSLEVNTFEDFDCELEYQSPLFSFKNDNQEVGLKFVLQSLT